MQRDYGINEGLYDLADEPATFLLRKALHTPSASRQLQFYGKLTQAGELWNQLHGVYRGLGRSFPSTLSKADLDCQPIEALQTSCNHVKPPL